MKNHQTTFNLFMKIARTHKGPSVDEDLMTCLYRGPNGERCLVGEIIAEEDYRDTMERTPADEGEVSELMKKYGHDPKLCRDIQLAHDNIIARNMDWHSWTKERWQAKLVEKMEEVADIWKLKY